MASINYAAREINVKIVYYGPGLSGKTTNLQVIHKKVPPEYKSDMVSLATETDRTLFFDFLPLDLGKIKGFSTKFQLYTVPGQVYYNATRKLVLRGVDGIVFVADSGQDKIQENIESFQNLEDNLAEYGYKRETIPIIIQYNKRDLPNALPVEQLDQYINKYQLPWGEAIANKGIGVFDSLKLIGKIVIDYLNKKYSRSGQQGSQSAPRPMAAQQSRRPSEIRVQPPAAASAGYNQLGGQPSMQPRSRFQGGQMPPPPPPRFSQQMRPQSPLSQQSMPPSMPAGGQLQQPIRQQQQYRPQESMVPPPQPQQQYVDMEQVQRPTYQPTTRKPVPPADDYQEQATFEPSQRPMQSDLDASPSGGGEDYYSYGSINLEPMNQQQQRAPAYPSQQMPPAQPQYEADFNQQQMPQSNQIDNFEVNGKTDLDLEIERYQREIEEKQRRTRPPSTQNQHQQTSYPPPQASYSPQSQMHQPQSPMSQHKPDASAQGGMQQDYEVYNLETPSFETQSQPAAQPMIGNSDDEEMFFTSVDTDRQKRHVKRPVNPRTQQQKGFLSKFFNKDMP